MLLVDINNKFSTRAHAQHYLRSRPSSLLSLAIGCSVSDLKTKVQLFEMNSTVVRVAAVDETLQRHSLGDLKINKLPAESTQLALFPKSCLSDLDNKAGM